MLARLILQSLSPTVLGALAQDVRKTYNPEKLNQDHYSVEGSLDERCSAVNSAFRKWCDNGSEAGWDSWDYSWWYCTVLSIFEDHLIFYCYRQGAYSYYKLGYTVDAGTAITFDASPETVDVKLVVASLGMAEDQAVETEVPAAVTEVAQVPNNETQTPVAQDAIPAPAGTSIISTDAPVSHSDGNPQVPATPTDANGAGASIPDPNASVTAATGVEHSGDEGVGAGSAEGTTGVPAITDDAEGFKGANPASPGMNVNVQQSKVGKAEFLIQSVGLDKANKSFAYILEQSAEEKDGKKLLNIQGIATKADIVSANGFVYPLAVWEQNLDGMNELATAGKFIGKLEHPDQEQGLADTAILFTKFWIQGSDVHFKAVVPETSNGKELQALIAAGAQIDMSSRGYGSATKQSWRGQEVMLIQDDFVCTAFDAVHHGASTGSGITDAQYQSATSLQEQGEAMPEKTPTQVKADGLREKALFQSTKADMLATSGLTTLGQKALIQAIDKAENLEALVEISESVLPILQSSFAVEVPDATEQVQSSTWAPNFMVKRSDKELAPQTVGEMIDRLVEDLPDTPIGTQAQGKMPNHFTSQRSACRRLMQNIANENKGGFNGRAAALGLLALEQGEVSRAQDILTQSLATGSTTAAGNADGGGAPLSAPLIFPLVRRVYPRYIMNEVASIQPMDRPEGKIFYLDHYRTEDPAGQEKRVDLNTSSSPFNSSYADNPTEGAAAQLIRLRLTSITVDAHTKKLGAAWSVEEMQDLRAYHGLDAAQELMSGVAREMALEWNLEVLNDMLAQASAASLTFGTGLPGSGFPNQIDWDAYIWNYIQKLDNAIFSKRNGPMTHIVCGVDAALALAKSGRMTFGIGGDNGGDMEEQYPGAVYFGVVNAPNGSRYKVFKTNFWATGTANGSKILGLRRGAEWSDTPYIWAPYTDYVTPVLTDPADFSQKQGIVSRAAKKVVVGDAMGVITVNNSTGVVL